jgi:hypothetical protein
MSKPASTKEDNYLKYAIIALVVVLVVLGIFFVQEYNNARKAQILDQIHRGVPLTAGEVTIIRPWMTFDYINRIFKLPPNYLKTNLSITDPSYPRATLSSDAAYSHTDATLLMNQVEGAVYNYLTTPAN